MPLRTKGFNKLLEKTWEELIDGDLIRLLNGTLQNELLIRAKIAIYLTEKYGVGYGHPKIKRILYTNLPDAVEINGILRKLAPGYRVMSENEITERWSEWRHNK